MEKLASATNLAWTFLGVTLSFQYVCPDSLCTNTVIQISTPLIILFVEKYENFISLFFPNILMSSLYNFSFYLIIYSLIEILLTYHTIYPFKAFKSMIFSVFTELCNHYDSQFWNIFITSEKVLYFLVITLLVPNFLS